MLQGITSISGAVNYTINTNLHVAGSMNTSMVDGRHSFLILKFSDLLH
jgi:hypothetical protein